MSKSSTALLHFDRYYPSIYSVKKWRSIRLALQTNPKKMFLLNSNYLDYFKLKETFIRKGLLNFLDSLAISPKNINQSSVGSLKNVINEEFRKSTEYIGDLEVYSKTLKNAFTDYTSLKDNERMSQFYEENHRSTLASMSEYEPLTNLPKDLAIYAYSSGVVNKLINVPKDVFNQAGFYPIDGFSLLTVLNLNIKEGDKILDMCAAPGGKSLAMIQTNLPGELVCIESSHSRFERLKQTLETHCNFTEWQKKIVLICDDANLHINRFYNYFDKVLVDVPCSSDRHAISDPNFSLFNPQNHKKRQQLNVQQTKLLRTAVSSCKIGGEVIYSTCTLSPVQNDRIVIDLINTINTHPDNDSYWLQLVNCHRNYHYSNKNNDNHTKLWIDCGAGSISSLGVTVLPNIIDNYGPGYFCKIRKLPKQ